MGMPRTTSIHGGPHGGNSGYRLRPPPFSGDTAIITLSHQESILPYERWAHMIPGGAYLWDPTRNSQVAIQDGTAKHRCEALHNVAQRMVWTNLRSQGSSLQHGGGGGAALDVHEAG